MTPSDSLHLDEHLARLLAAYDQGIDDGKGAGGSATIDLPRFPPDSGERRVGPLSGSNVNQGSMDDLLPDSSRGDPFVAPSTSTTPETHRVGRFELRRQLGRGGCGIVFLAHDPKLKRDVALKIPRPELLMNTDARKRLVREATAAAAFDHPNLVPVYETGEIGPVCFIATVFCPGQTLAEWLDRQAFPVPLRQAARLVAQLAEAVQHAHDRGVLHRDLKPNNVILQEAKSDPNAQEAPPGACPLRGDYFTPRIVDFGLAKLADQGPGETATRQVLGTPKYMAPEQAQARHEDVGPEADVYALGGILYEMMTGRAPYEGATDVEVLRQCIEGNLTPPRSLRIEIARDLEAICIKSLARSPGRRYRTAIDFADDLRRFLDGLPTLARPLNGLGRTSRWLRRNDQLFALITVSAIAVLLLASGFWSAYQSRKMQVVQDESKLRDAERTRMDYAKLYAQHVRNAFHLWEAGDREAFEIDLRDAKIATTTIGSPPEFAWGYLTNLSRAKPQLTACPGGRPLAIAVSPDGTRFATGHEKGTLTVWNRESMQPLASVKAHEKNLTRIAFRNGSKIVTVGSGAVREWSLGANGEPKPIPTSLTPHRAIALAADGTTLAWIDARTIHLGSHEIPGSAGAVALTFVSDGRTGWLLAAGMADGTVRIFDQERREMRSLPGHGAAIVSLSASADGSNLAALGEDGSLTRWNLKTGAERIQRGIGHSLRDLAFAPDGQTLLLAADDGIRVMNSAADPDGPALRGLSSPVTRVATRDSGEHAIAYADGSIDVLSQRGHAPKRFPAQGRKPLAVLAFPESGPVIGVETDEQHVSVWEFGKEAKLLFRQPMKASVVDFSAATGWLAAANDRGMVTVWSLETREIVGTVETKHDALRHLSFSENGRWLAIPIDANAIGVWFVGEPTIQIRLPAYSGDTRLVKFLGDDRIATVVHGSMVKVWSLMSLREEYSLIGHSGRITCLTSSSDQRTLASGAADGEVKVWDLRTGQELLGRERHNGSVLAAEFSADRRSLLTVGGAPGNRGELVYWDAVQE